MENNSDTIDHDMHAFKIELPNATAVLVLGILSIVFCWCVGIPGLAMGIIALVLAKNAEALYYEDPTKYTEASFKNMNAGKICAIIGTSFSGLYIVMFIVRLVYFGSAFGNLMHLPWDQIH